MKRLLTLFAIAAMFVLTAVVASAETGTVTVTGGSLAVTPADITNFSEVVLDGTDKTSTSAFGGNSWAAEDPTGTGTGWNLTIISTDFGIDEVQTVSITGATAGDFTLSYGSTEPIITTAIAYTATAGDVDTALEVLGDITTVTTTGGPLPATDVVVTFVDPGKQNVAAMVIDGGGLTDGTPAVSTTTQGRTIDITTVADQAFKIQLEAAHITVTAGSDTKPTTSVASLTDIPETGGSALKFLSAAEDAGMGDYAIQPNFTLDVRSETYAGTYTATFTVAIVSAP